jgi:branched-chain amino acid transport system permease protein
VDKGVPFALAILFGIASMIAVGLIFQVLVLRRLAGQPVFTGVMVTIGLNIVIIAMLDYAFGGAPRESGVGDPFGATAVTLGDVTLLWVNIWTIIITAAILAGFFLFDRFSRYGLATRATAVDEEAALAVGIPVRRVKAIAWGTAGALAAIAGVFLSGYPNGHAPTTGDVALLAFPAIIIGGLDSPVGAVVGGLIIGLVYEMTEGYGGDISFLGKGFYSIAPYIVMIVVLLVRPYGIFGRRPVERV